MKARELATLVTPSSRRVISAIRKAGGQARFVGGCVRDALLSRPFSDIDLAVTLLPEKVMAAAQTAGLKVVPTGLKHGTVMVVCDGHPIELTTLRRDISTDGRHAEVAFTDDWKQDAARRDFTMNALFCDEAGTLADYVGGEEDARAGRVRFVGDAPTRIREDVLRILRFFRFHALYGRGAPDGAALEACAELRSLLPRLSAERVSGEIMKIFSAPEPAPVMRLMADLGIFAALKLPFTNMAHLEKVSAFPGTLALHRLWAALPEGADVALVTDVARALRLSTAVTKRLKALADIASRPLPEGEPTLARLAYREGVEAVCDALSVRGRATPPALRTWTRPAYPLKGEDIEALGVARGPRVGTLLAEGEQWWVEQNFLPGRAACLEKTRTLLR